MMIIIFAARPLLEQNPAPPAPGPEFGGSSPIGLVVTLLLLIALIFLIRSMNKHLRKVPESFDPPEEQARNADEATADDGQQASGEPSDRPGADGATTTGGPPRGGNGGAGTATDDRA